MAEKKTDTIKNIMINLGILLILFSTMVIKDLGLPFFFLGLVLLALQTMDTKGIEPGKLVTAQILIAAALSIATVTQLAMSKNSGSSQVFLIILLLGGIIITVEAVRRYVDL